MERNPCEELRELLAHDAWRLLPVASIAALRPVMPSLRHRRFAGASSNDIEAFRQHIHHQ